ncbi:MAG: peptide deformylase [Actinomycetota bacterium]
MPVREVLRLPERVLKLRSEELNERPAGELVADLIDTMRVSPACVGLAAPQIGVNRRVIAVDVTGHPRTRTCHGLVCLVDPVVVDSWGREAGREGCMSVPDLTANVARSKRVVVQGIDQHGDERVIATDAFEARALQHEIDHLDGLLILDRVASLSTDVFRRQTYR